MNVPAPDPEPSPARAGDASRAPRSLASAALMALAAVAALLLALALFGLLPTRTPAPARVAKFDVEQAVERPALVERAHTPPAHRLSLWSFPLCPRPPEGARLVRLALRPEREAFVVWCQNEYLLVEVEARADARERTEVEARARDPDSDAELVQVTRLARFPARAELPGGAAALDLDRDGVLDLVLGVAPQARVAHRSFAGVFWLRGRAQGGYELPRALVEMPPVALAALELDSEPGSELVVLTRGDPAAQRPGELWVFGGGTSPSRVAVLPAALAPSDLALSTGPDGAVGLWVVSTQPGSLLRLRVSREGAPLGSSATGSGATEGRSAAVEPGVEARASARERNERDAAHSPVREPNKAWALAVARTELPLRGAQAFVAGPRGEGALFVRDVLHTYRIENEPTPKLTPWIEEARVGPAAWFDADGDRKPELLAASEGGFVWVDGKSRARRERALPGGVRVLDATSVTALGGRPRGVLLVGADAPGSHLALVVLPSELRAETAEIELLSGAVAAAPGEARVALE